VLEDEDQPVDVGEKHVGEPAAEEGKKPTEAFAAGFVIGPTALASDGSFAVSGIPAALYDLSILF
jgi:hypothetical protein